MTILSQNVWETKKIANKLVASCLRVVDQNDVLLLWPKSHVQLYQLNFLMPFLSFLDTFLLSADIIIIFF